MKALIKFAASVAVVSIALFAWWKFLSRDASRIVIRADGQYEVELWYGPLGWSEMGGPFKTIEEARDKVEYWKKFDEEQKREKAIKRRVVEH